MSDSKLVAANPAAKARTAILAEMTPETQKVAKLCDECLTKAGAVDVLCRYRVGQHISKVLKQSATNEATFGVYAIEQIADFIGENPTTLHNLKQVAEAFSEEFIKEWSSRPNSKGKCLTISHFVHAAMPKSAKERETMLARAIANGWSSRELLQEINATGSAANTRKGGRLPGRPANPISGIHELTKIALRFNRYETKIAGKFVFEPIQDYDAESVTPALDKKLAEADEEFGKLAESVDDARKQLGVCRERVTEVLAKKTTEATEDEPAPAKPKAAKPKAKPAQVGKKPSANGKKPPQAAKRKPQPAHA